MEPSASREGAEARERLRHAFVQFRDRAKLLAAEIARSLPDYTVHDITHLDALWEMADLVAGPDVSLNPLEAFVLGGAFLLHDLGMGLAAYPGGLEELKAHPIWRDTVASELMRLRGRPPTPRELRHPRKEIEELSVREVLRALHAERASQLALVEWKDPTGTAYHLLEDVELRTALGALIGHVAHSHHWPVSRLKEKFSRELGALSWCPTDWTIDPLKVACLLRLADAVHIDERRAPGFLRALRRPPGHADAHWAFQQRMQKPLLKGDRLVFTSASAFPLEEASSWWLCMDVLVGIDRELRQVDALLADLGRDRLAARSVAGVEEPSRLTELVRTEGWLPVDARFQVSDVPSLIARLGGRELYGENALVPLRELIQNAADAIRARRILDEHPEDWGDIVVRVGKDEQGEWLEVEDNGIGMSEQVLTGHLLDFGVSYWTSGLVRHEHPGLIAKGFKPAGKYGIGFFSVFILGEKVRVTSRRFDHAREDTRVLEINSGVVSRPILRSATRAEQVREGGTRVRVWFKEPMNAGHLTVSPIKNKALPLPDTCAWLCPCLDVHLRVETPDGKRRTAVRASDWQNLDGAELLRRIEGRLPVQDAPPSEELERLGQRLRLVRGPDGTVFGRACVAFDAGCSLGLISAGGLRACVMKEIAGVLVGAPARAIRDAAIPLLPPKVLAQWASEQAQLLSEEVLPEGAPHLYHAAQQIRKYGGNTAALPIALSARGGMSYASIVEWGRVQDTVRLVELQHLLGSKEGLTLDRLAPDVLLVDSGLHSRSWWDDFYLDRYVMDTLVHDPSAFIEGSSIGRATLGTAIHAMADAWSVPVNKLLKVSSLTWGWFTEGDVGTLASGDPVKGNVMAVLRKP
jgi:hypothetical protein